MALANTRHPSTSPHWSMQCTTTRVPCAKPN